MFNRLMAPLRLARIGNALLSGLAVWVGGAVGAQDFSAAAALWGGLAAALAAASGNAVNDLFDCRIDREAKPERPLPSGQLSPRAARLWAVAWMVAALLCALQVSRPVFLVVLGALALLWLYSARLKGARGLGHIVIAMLAGFCFPFGVLAQGESLATMLPQGWVIFGFALVWHLAREWVKAAEDVEFDRAAGVETLAVARGVAFTCRMAASLLILLLVALWPPFIAGYFSLLYLFLCALAVAPVLLASAVYLWGVPDPVRLGQLSRLLKWDMLVGISAVWFGLP